MFTSAHASGRDFASKCYGRAATLVNQSVIGVKFHRRFNLPRRQHFLLKRSIAMVRIAGFLFGSIILIVAIGCGGGSSTPAPTPTPTPGQIFPNDESLAQTPPVKLGTSGGNANDLGTKVCCIGT